MQTVSVSGDGSQALREHMPDWQGQGGTLWREGPDKHLHVSAGPLLPGLLPLGSDPARGAKILRWFFDENRELREARESDHSDITKLEGERIREGFVFLEEEEREREVAAVASPERVREDMERDDFWICKKDGQIWAIGAMRDLGGGEGLVFSGYSKGEGAGAALLALRIQEAERRGWRKLWGEVYGYNSQGSRHLLYQGFRLSSRLRTSQHNPPPSRARLGALYLVQGKSGIALG